MTNLYETSLLLQQFYIIMVAKVKTLGLFAVQESVTKLESIPLHYLGSTFKTNIKFRTIKTSPRRDMVSLTKFFFKFTLISLILLKTILIFIILIADDADWIISRCSKTFALWLMNYIYPRDPLIKPNVDEALGEIKKEIYNGEILNALYVWIRLWGRLERYKQYRYYEKPRTEKEHNDRMQIYLDLMLKHISSKYTLKVTKYFFKYLPWIHKILPNILNISHIVTYLIVFVGIILIIYALLTHKPNDKYEKNR